MLLWPLLVAAILTKRLRHLSEDGEIEERDAHAREKIEDARRAFVVAVNRMLEATRRTRTIKREATEATLYAVREAVEQYVGLAGVVANLNEDGPPASHEMELARVSGRRGSDLLRAGHCAHRRNVSRIRTHYERERARLLGKLSELRAEEGNSLPPDACDEASEHECLSEARLEIYLRAGDLFSLLEDERASRLVAQLSDAEGSDSRRLQETKILARGPRSCGEEQCTNATRLIYTDPRRSTIFTQG
jgi:hypothetical protein